MRNCKSILLTIISLVTISCEEKMPELSLGVPTMGEVEVTDNGSLVFELQGSLTSYEHLVSECGFYIGTDASMEGASRYPCKLTGKTFSTTQTLQGYNRKYYVCSYITNGRSERLSEKKIINIGPLSSYVTFGKPRCVSIDDAGTAHFEIPLTVAEGVHISSLSIAYGKTPEYSSEWKEVAIPYVKGEKVSFGIPNTSEDDVSYYRFSFSDSAVSDCSRVFSTEENISSESANCYIVSEPGVYKFKTVKGNSNISVGSVSSCEVLWETFGTATTPSKGDLIKSVSYSDGYITFETASTYKEGNAVIAAKEASGNILWSWHIWFTDQPQGQTYNNGAGVMMDRNLGATSATKGDVGALGLLYQWGRKDPFLNSSSISDDIVAKSTITWPSTVYSSSSTGTISYATAHPTTFIAYNSNNDDWYYSSGSSTDNTRWQSSKTIYDPCPAGWRVPDGGSTGVWSKAFGTSSYWATSSNWDSTNNGMDFSKTDKKLGSSGPIWYPASGYRHDSSGALSNVGSRGYYWSVSPLGHHAYFLYFSYSGYVGPAGSSYRAYGQSVRCLQE